MDETGFRIGTSKSQYVLTEQPEKSHFLPIANNRESLTVVEAVSAGGNVIAIPAMLVIAAKQHQSSWFQNLHDTTLVGVADNGYMNDELMVRWIAHFEKHSQRSQRGAWRLLLLDGYGSHHTYEFIKYCDEHKIIPFGLPSHSTHFLQPLDVVVFQPYKHYHSEAVNRAARLGCSDYNKLEFFNDFEYFRRQALSPGTIRAAFEKTGIWPINAAIVVAFVRARIEAIRRAPARTPTPPPTYDITTPRTVRTLKRHSGTILNDNLLHPALKTRLLPLLRGAQIQAIAGAEAVEELKDSTVVAAASRARGLQKRSSLQRGGVLTTANARRMVQNREDDEIEKAKKIIERADQAAFKQRTATMLKAIQPGGSLPMWKKYRAKVIPIWCKVMDELVDTTRSNV